MVPEIDIWCAANLWIRRHGANAEHEAAKRADRGDDEGRLGVLFAYTSADNIRLDLFN